jgi:GLPGLI family protein
MKRIIVLYIAVIISFAAKAQYTMQGKIEYERTFNLHHAIEDMDEDSKEWLEKIKAQIPKVTTNYYELHFNTSKSVYKPGKESENTSKLWFATPPGSENIIYTDFSTSSVKANKKIFEERFLVVDTARKIKWVIKDEIRTIANYKCRKAVGKMFDSVYVVAFYTDDIIASGGPEMFGGLPGMIMQITVPRLHCTWLATKVEIAPPKETDLIAPDKGKKVTQNEMFETLKDSFKRWGKNYQRFIWWAMI